MCKDGIPSLWSGGRTSLNIIATANMTGRLEGFYHEILAPRSRLIQTNAMMPMMVDVKDRSLESIRVEGGLTMITTGVSL